MDNCLKLLKPLFLPTRRGVLGIGDIYASQAIIKDSAVQASHTVSLEEFDDSVEKERLRRIGERYDAVVSLIISEAMKSGTIRLSTILSRTRENNPLLYDEIVSNRCIFITALKLYDIGTIYISGFYYGLSRVIMQPSEEFNIEYCLVKIRDAIDGIENVRELQVEKTGEEIDITIERIDGEIKSIERVRMTDLVFKVVM